MDAAVAIIVSLTFVVLALWHFRMALSTDKGTGGAVPSQSGKPLFVTRMPATLSQQNHVLRSSRSALAAAPPR